MPEFVHSHILPAVGTKRGKIKFVSQADSVPPKFIFHVNNEKAFHATYRRYLENKLREKFGFHGTPIRMEFRDAMDEFKGKKKKK
jgi:GTP-binding protein